MVEILKSFELIATQLSPIVLVLPGLIATALGLFIWLGGLGFRRTLLALVGALAGATVGFCAANQHLAVVVLSGVLGALVGALLRRFFSALLAGLLGAVVAFLIVAWPHLRQNEGVSLAAPSGGGGEERMSLEKSLEVVRVYAVDLTDTVRRAVRQVAAERWAVVAVAGVSSLGGGLFLRHAGLAASCSIVGASTIFLGLVLLLFEKGSAPVTRIAQRPGYYILVFMGMVAFGAAEQWLLCRHLEHRHKGGSKRAQAGQKESKRSWRGQ